MADEVFEALPWQPELEVAVKKEMASLQRDDDLEEMVWLSMLERREAAVVEAERRSGERARELDRREALLNEREDREAQRARETQRLQEAMHHTIIAYGEPKAPTVSVAPRAAGPDPRLPRLSRQLFAVEALVHEMTARSLGDREVDVVRAGRSTPSKGKAASRPSIPSKEMGADFSDLRVVGPDFSERVRDRASGDRRYETSGWRRRNVEEHMRSSTPKGRRPKSFDASTKRPGSAPAVRSRARLGRAAPFPDGDEHAADAPLDPHRGPKDAALAQALARSLEVLGRETGSSKKEWRKRLQI